MPKPKETVIASEYSLAASICRESFFEFVKEFWGEVISDDPVWNWHIEYICDELQTVAERVFKNQPKLYDLIINISPGSTKSTICSRMFPAWIWTRMPSAVSICGSFAFPLATSLSVSSRDIITSDRYKALFPDIRIRTDMGMKTAFMNTKQGERRAVSVSSAVTGNHGHFLIIDDPLDPLGARSDVDRVTANKWMTETLLSRVKNKKTTPLILIMQRLHQVDPTGYLLELMPDKIKHICLPATTEYDIKPTKLKRKYKNGLMDTIRLDREILKSFEVALGQYGYAGQFGQRPVPIEGGMFKWERCVIDDPGNRIRFMEKVRYWDKAGSTTEQSAWTAGVLMGKEPSGRFWILDVIRGRWLSHQREEIIKATAILDGVKTTVGIEQEPGSGGKESAENTVKNLAGFTVVVDRPIGDKAFRADPLSVQVNGNNVSIARNPDWNKIFLDEMQFFPNSKFKDQIDAASAGFAIITKRKMRAGALLTRKQIQLQQ